MVCWSVNVTCWCLCWCVDVLTWRVDMLTWRVDVLTRRVDVLVCWCVDDWFAEEKKYFLAGSASWKKKHFQASTEMWTSGNHFVWCCELDVLVKKYIYFKNTKNTSPHFFLIFSTTKQRDFIAPFVNRQPTKKEIYILRFLEESGTL